jgi:hypothetical protein
MSAHGRCTYGSTWGKMSQSVSVMAVANDEHQPCFMMGLRRSCRGKRPSQLLVVIHGHRHGGGGRGCKAPAKVMAVNFAESPPCCPWCGNEVVRPRLKRGSRVGRCDAGANGVGSPKAAPCTRCLLLNHLCAELLPPLRGSGERHCSGCRPVPSFIRSQTQTAVVNGMKRSGIAYSTAVNFFTQHCSGPTLRAELKVRLCSFELDWISTFVCASPWLSSTLLMSHMSPHDPVLDS